MSNSSTSIALNDLKKQLDSLSESLDHFDPEERNKALEILQECIQGLESKSDFSLSEGLQEVLNSINGMPENKQSNVFTMLNDEMCQEAPSEMKGESGSDSNSFEEMKMTLVSESPVKSSECSFEGSCQDLNTSDEMIEDEQSEYNTQSDEDCESQYDGEWKCPKCGEEYNDKSSLMEHLQQYSGKLKSCAACHNVFQNSVAYTFHKQLYLCEKPNRVFKCKLCSKVMFKESQYSNHLSAHKRNQCRTCGEHFSRRKHLDAHSVTVHNTAPSKDVFRCHLCERTFTQRRSLVYHYKISHPGNDLVCPTCLEMFDSADDLEAHQATHKKQTFTCDKCDEQFSRRQQYLVHMKKHDKFKCQSCDKSFAAKKAALKHVRESGHQVSGLAPQLQCAVCGQLFMFPAELNTHMTVHTGGKTLACEKCKVVFNHERNYLSHLETNEHLRGEEPKNLLPCKQCKKTFTNKNNLRAHVSRMHRPNLVEHTCTHCSYKTTLFVNLRRHIALHTDKPKFICDKCGAQLQTKSSLQDHHQQLHSDVKEFSCDKCGKMFSRASELNRHLSSIHSETPKHTCHCGNSYKTPSNLKRHQLLSHGNVELKKKRLKKLFQTEENIEPPPKKKVRKLKKKKESSSTTEVENLPQLPEMSSIIAESNTVVMMAERHPVELLQVPYNIDFTEDKSHVVYTQNLDMGALHVVESMIQLEGDPNKEGTSIMINVRNLFGRPLTNDYILPSTMESSIVDGLGDGLTDATQHLGVTDQKQDVISGLQEYIIHQDLNFLNV